MLNFLLLHAVYKTENAGSSKTRKSRSHFRINCFPQYRTGDGNFSPSLSFSYNWRDVCSLIHPSHFCNFFLFLSLDPNSFQMLGIRARHFNSFLRKFFFFSSVLE